MPNIWDNEENVSCLLSVVMEEIGVNEEMVGKRRSAWLLIETFYTLVNKCNGNNNEVYIFGSQTEGTTTLGLASDTDCLYLFKGEFNIIQKLSEWQPGAVNLLMFQDDKTSPGHCLLQILRPNAPLPAETPIPNLDYKYQHRYTGGKIVMKNSGIEKYCRLSVPRSGPSFVYKTEGNKALDTIFAFSCKTMPRSVTRGLKKNQRQGRMSEDMMKYIQSKGCFVVGTGRKGSVNKELEWRISTSHAERVVMFSLNITQVQCYVLIKMICNTYLKHSHDTSITTFMCKNVFLQTVAKTPIAEWNRQTLLKCLKNCLIELKDSIAQAQCPHFIVHGNNIMHGQFSSKTRKWLYGILQNLIQGNDLGLFGVKIDMLGKRLLNKLNNFDKIVPIVRTLSLGSVSLDISGELLRNCVNWIITGYYCLALSSKNLDPGLKTLESIYLQGSKEERKACCLLKPLIVSSLGCELASTAIQAHSPLSPQVLEMLKVGTNSDAASGRLKQASVFYSAGKIQRAEWILRETAEIYNKNAVSAVYEFPKISQMFKKYSYVLSEGAIKHVAAFDVTFRRSEIHCLPKELQYEMFRCIPEDPLNFLSIEIVDSLPYLYFLQYKTYCRLQRWGDQQRALTNLQKIIDFEQIRYPETALNLLGQCMEQENRPNDALSCYVRSLRIRPKNNAANWHVLIKVYKIFYKRNAEKNTFLVPIDLGS